MSNQLVINAIDKHYEVYFNGATLTGTDSAQSLAHSIAEIISTSIPDFIYVLTGPGSFTSTRIGIITAKTLSIAWSIPIKSCSIIDLLPDHHIAFSTGTSKYMLWDTCKTNLVSIEELKEKYQDYMLLSSDPKLGHISHPVPSLVPLMVSYLADKSIDPDPQPFYPITPDYL